MKINIKLKIPRRKSTKAAKYDVSQLKNEELQRKYAVEEESEKCGLFTNIRKTKIMVSSREKVIPQIDIKIDGERVEQVANFTYLGHWITEDGRSDQEVNRRIGKAKHTFSRMSKLLTNRSAE
ncbi:catenin (Cadherin-associated protein), alpha 3 [Elysia marginata]|uniref:Catenin (Cadherin-associated protein), alpha 3 n=1 Tax=Elysia marginata TaxID=1093978 RepID=A0AAV4FR35_9GAST|nr:catenin (Cadherin-associated protein), alpha 3 [Elysia marginata]